MHVAVWGGEGGIGGRVLTKEKEYVQKQSVDCARMISAIRAEATWKR